MVCQGVDGAEVASIECQHRVRLEGSREGHVHSISEVEPQVEVARPDCLGRIEDVGRHLGEDGATCPRPSPDVIDRLRRGFGTEDTTSYMVELAQQYRRHDQRPSVAQNGAGGVTSRMSRIEGGQQSGRVRHHDDQGVGFLVRS